MRINLQKFSERADSVYTRAFMALISFTESCVFVIPPDPLLIALVLVRPERWLRLALFTTCWSLAGALFGYVLGAFLYDTFGAHIVAFYHLEHYMETARAAIDHGVFIFTFTMAFTPIPFKIAVFTAGMTHANFISFVSAIVIGRTARYVVIAFVARFFGDRAGEIIKKYSIPVAFVGMVVLALWALLALM